MSTNSEEVGMKPEKTVADGNRITAKAIEAEASLARQGRGLSDEQERLCREYAQDVLGSDRFQHWLRVFTAYNQEFREGWIPHDYFSEIVVRRTKGLYSYLGMMSAMNFFLFGDDFKLDIGCYAGGRFLTQNGEMLSEDDFKQHLIDSADDIVFKADLSDRGRNIFFMKSASVNLTFMKRFGMGSFQRRVTQHQSLAEIGSDAVATIRLTTVVEPDGTVTLRNAFLRLGHGSQTHIMADNIKVRIDEGGILGEESVNLAWEIKKEHPDSGFMFKGFVIPEYAKVVEEAVRLHAKVPFLSVIGWDFTLDENLEPQVLEYNTASNGFIYGETFSGPCFKGLGWESLWRD